MVLLLAVAMACGGPDTTSTPSLTEFPGLTDTELPPTLPLVTRGPTAVLPGTPGPTVSAETPMPPSSTPINGEDDKTATPGPTQTLDIRTPTIVVTPTQGPTSAIPPTSTPVPAITPDAKPTPTLPFTPATATVIPTTPPPSVEPPSTPVTQPTPTSAPTLTPAIPPTPTLVPTPTPVPSPTQIPTATQNLPTPTPKATPPSSFQPEWTLELELIPEPKDVPGPSNLFMGVNNLCPELISCSGQSAPPAPGLEPFEVYFCHPGDNQENCDGLPHLSSSWLPPAEVQTWVVEATYEGFLEKITLAWRPQVLPDTLILHIIVDEDRFDMQFPPEPVRSLELDMGTNVTRSFIICSRTSINVPFDRCFE